MVDEKNNGTLLRLGDLLDYPDVQLSTYASECVQLLASTLPDASHQIKRFLDFVGSTTQGRMEEIYTGTFDMNPACYIFAGYILFGESFNRGKFLVRLQKEYRERGFSAGNELADHLAVMFKFMAILDPNEHTAQLLMKECFVPVLMKMNTGFKNENENPNPYRQVLRAILSVLEQTMEDEQKQEALLIM
ncbi:MAG: nitrate reductase molybdenum cofactor assembly chaperone [Desulfobacterales bacterium]|nr:nitrate reductase molybdenum cofactor assembly chaperone [Desulfobacterales bacterium]